MTRLPVVLLGAFLAVQVVAQDAPVPASKAPAAEAPKEAPAAADAKTEGAPASEAAPAASDQLAGPPEAGAAVAKKLEKSPEEKARDKAKKEFSETVERFRKISDAFNAEIMATIKRKRDARMRRIDIDFEQRILELERKEAERRKSAIAAFERFVIVKLEQTRAQSST